MATSTTSNIAAPNFAATDVRDDQLASVSIRRVDAPHDGRGNVADCSPEPDMFDPAALRAAHADDLIEFLQHWSEELDMRSARLNADIATHERRERAFRLWMQNQRIECEQLHQSCQQTDSELKSKARRLAFESKVF